MKIHDISMQIHHDMMVYKDKEEKRPAVEVTRDYPEGARESKIHLEMHTGTHVDAPMHMIEGGESIDKLDLYQVVTQCRVIDLTYLTDSVKREDLTDKDIKKGEFILLKTKNSFDERFNPEFVFLKKSGAEYLAEKGIKGVGIDSLGIERSQPGHETHITLFKNGITIIEGLRLKDIPEGNYLLAAAPLYVVGAEGAPARALLIEM
ncbi:MAG: cyclase family protein [Thermoanaerobacteraceae bacterium]|nr:cyclase family protein [Thermoanaerobacteraceae bacterium]